MLVTRIHLTMLDLLLVISIKQNNYSLLLLFYYLRLILLLHILGYLINFEIIETYLMCYWGKNKDACKCCCGFWFRDRCESIWKLLLVSSSRPWLNYFVLLADIGTNIHLVLFPEIFSLPLISSSSSSSLSTLLYKRKGKNIYYYYYAWEVYFKWILDRIRV